MVDLCLRSGLSDFPTKRRDQLIILKSISVAFEPGKQYLEPEVNEEIKSWLTDINCFPGWDYLMLRRRLVDDGFLTRNRDGSFYWVNPSGPAEIVFDPAIIELDINEVLAEGKNMIAEKKAAYQQNH